MAENGIDSSEYRRFIKQPSGNMDDTGYFSVQVISRALSLWNLELIPRNSSDPIAIQYRNDPARVPAYIFHMENHWFCIRRFGDIWFNLNSTVDTPKFMSSLYLTEYLKQMEQDGYMVFIVSGILPECTADSKPPTELIQPLISSSSRATMPLTGGRRLNSPTPESSLEAAMKLSMECFENSATIDGAAVGTAEEKPPSANEIRERRLAFFAAKNNKQ